MLERVLSSCTDVSRTGKRKVIDDEEEGMYSRNGYRWNELPDGISKQRTPGE